MPYFIPSREFLGQGTKRENAERLMGSPRWGDWESQWLSVHRIEKWTTKKEPGKSFQGLPHVFIRVLISNIFILNVCVYNIYSFMLLLYYNSYFYILPRLSILTRYLFWKSPILTKNFPLQNSKNSTTG